MSALVWEKSRCGRMLIAEGGYAVKRFHCGIAAYHTPRVPAGCTLMSGSGLRKQLGYFDSFQAAKDACQRHCDARDLGREAA
ncbi:MAG: hypothetical protein HY749_16135 [Gammaproteobacteria bacterium]|nr:hypothetical protein [Gammaproteobacteria bacterium]